MKIIDPRSGKRCLSVKQIIIKCCSGRHCVDCPLETKKTGVSCVQLIDETDLLYVASLAEFQIIEDDDVKQIEISSDELMGLLGG